MTADLLLPIYVSLQVYATVILAPSSSNTGMSAFWLRNLNAYIGLEDFWLDSAVVSFSWSGTGPTPA